MEEYLKDNWTEQFKQDFAALPKIIQELAGDLFEIKWYGGGGLQWDLEHNLLGDKAKAHAFMMLYKNLTDHQRKLIYYAYEA